MWGIACFILAIVAFGLIGSGQVLWGIIVLIAGVLIIAKFASK